MSGEKIFIVEDEGIVAEDLEVLLTRLGYEVVGSVASGDKAIKEIGATKPDLVLMDIHIQGSMDGIDVAEHVYIHFDIPVIYLTAYANHAMVDRAKGTLPSGYILKPFEERSLKTAIELALHRHRMGEMIKTAAEWHGDILGSLDMALITSDNDGNINYMNKIAEAMTGRFLDLVLGKSIDEVLTADGPATGPVSSRFSVRKNGQRIPIECKQAVIKDRAGNSTGRAFLINEPAHARLTEAV